MKKSLFDVQSLMNVVQADLPMTGANLKPSWVLAIDPLNIPVLSLAVTGEVYDGVQLRTLVENEVVNRLKTVKDVYSVVPFGGQKLQMQVVADRERLAAYRRPAPALWEIWVLGEVPHQRSGSDHNPLAQFAQASQIVLEHAEIQGFMGSWTR